MLRHKAAALKKAHKAAEHDAWFRSEVQKSLNDTRQSLSHDDFKDRMNVWMLKNIGERP